MNCWHCDRPAHGVCRFCGRGVCKEHAQTMPYIITIYRDGDGMPMALVVVDALYCGICKPKQDPIPLPQLK
ncbi:MAG: hypothetical protein JXA33_04765 [Anaerolineae bacterium]|nr:hypothetical protein [Anaerolineae bacterium]